MSRRRGEFEHRTSIFEGAYRAWSHLGGLDPEELECRPASELDPLTNPIRNDARIKASKKEKVKFVQDNDDDGDAIETMNPDGSPRQEYPYEPLPRAGLSHPYVQAVLSPWLGPDADNEAIQLGLTTLRTWWQHRRKGESGSAVAALGTEKMKGVVEGYTRHFFTLAHCLIVSDKEQPPRSLNTRMKELEKNRAKRKKKKVHEHEAGRVMSAVTLTGIDGQPLIPSVLSDNKKEGGSGSDELSPLERLHFDQRRQLAASGSIHPTIPGLGTLDSTAPILSPSGDPIPIINMKGQCVPGKIDLEEVVDKVSRHASQLAYRGTAVPAGVTSSDAFNGLAKDSEHSMDRYRSGGPLDADAISMQQQRLAQQTNQYGDPTLTPVVFVSSNGDIQISMHIEGITCAHCVKIVETVLKGCTGNKSPIEGLLDAAADRSINSVLIRIDRASSAKRVAFESARNLAMVGYTARARQMSIVGPGADKKATMDLGKLATAFEVVAATDPRDVFNWSARCACPDNGILREDCPR
jgi:copper chaperone CopZ